MADSDGGWSVIQRIFKIKAQKPSTRDGVITNKDFEISVETNGGMA